MDRRNFISAALAACAAPAVPMMLKPRSVGASTLAADFGSTGATPLHCWIVDPLSGLMKLHSYKASGLCRTLIRANLATTQVFDSATLNV